MKVGDLVRWRPELGVYSKIGIITEIQSDGAYCVHFSHGVVASCTEAEIRIINESR